MIIFILVSTAALHSWLPNATFVAGQFAGQPGILRF